MVQGVGSQVGPAVLSNATAPPANAEHVDSTGLPVYPWTQKVPHFSNRYLFAHVFFTVVPVMKAFSLHGMRVQVGAVPTKERSAPQVNSVAVP
jgi:hypothetical protein